MAEWMKWHKIAGIIIIGLIAYIFIQQSQAQYIEIKTELDTNQVLIGDQFNLFIKVSQPPGLIVEYPEFSDTIIDKIEILQKFPPDTSIGEDNQINIQQRYLLTSFDSGLYVIPPVLFRFSAADWSDSISSNPVYLAVYTVPVDSAGRIFDIKSPLGAPITVAEMWPYILGGSLLVILIAAGVWYFRRRKSDRPVLAFSRPQIPPYVVAIRELDRLSEEKLWQQGRIKDYYTRLTGIIRIYIEHQFDIPAMEMTSDETLRMWNEIGMKDEDLYIRLKDLLGLADLVKFAKEKPLPSYNESNLNNAYDFVRKTRPVTELGSEIETMESDPTEIDGTASGKTDNDGTVPDVAEADVAEADVIVTDSGNSVSRGNDISDTDIAKQVDA